MAGSDAPETGRRGAQPRGNSIQLSPYPSMQVQEGREDKLPKGKEEKCPGLLTSPSSASSSSLFSPSSPPRVRRGIKTQLLRGMQGGGSGTLKTGGKESTSKIWRHFYFPQVQIRGPRDFTCAPSATGLFPMRSCDKHAQSHLPLSSSPSTDFPSTPPPSLSPPSPPCPLNKSIQNQPNPAAVGKPAPRTRTHTRTNRKRERLNTIKKPVIKVIKL